MNGFDKIAGKERRGDAASDLPAKPPEPPETPETQSATPVPLRPRRKCPICGKKAVQVAYPFCSIRCADIDLNRWLSGRYRIAGSADDDDVPPAQIPSANDGLNDD